MITEEIIKEIARTASAYFSKNEMIQYAKQIQEFKFTTLHHFICITQDKGIVQLESSFLTENLIFDFTFSRSKSEVAIIPIRAITYLRRNINNEKNMTLVIGSNAFTFVYNTFNANDTELLNIYSTEIAKRINL